MKLTSQSFKEGEFIPGEFAFAIPDSRQACRFIGKSQPPSGLE